ncbi:MAG: GLUG motif-containing protein [Sedimentisphaerales bacterium]
MKRAISTILVILAVSTSAQAKYSGGSGDPNTPYQIANVADLMILAADINDYNKCFIMTADINMAGQTFGTAIIAQDTSISDGFQGTSFTGNFDGNSHKITNFILSCPYQYIGLFGQIDSGSSVKNLGLENFAVSGYKYVGGLVGNNVNGTIRNCYSTGQITSISQSYYIGGLVGFNSGSITNCYSTFQAFQAGGYVFTDNPPNQISGFYGVGGLAGCNAGTIIDCYSTAEVSGPAGNGGAIGGLTGGNTGNISNCYSTGIATGTEVGGFAGFNTGSIIKCHSTGQVNGVYLLIGGFVGENFGRISRCYSTGIVNGSSGANMVGGLVGDNDSGGVISSCYSTGSVSVTANGVNVGGLAGMNYASNIINCYATGSVNGYNKVGGLAGRTYHGSNINYCFSIGQTIGSTNVGGLVGVNDSDSNTLNSFWDINTSGLTTSAAGTGQTTVQMKTLSTFTGVGWDFVWESANGPNDVWAICEGVSYPKLAWQFIVGDSDNDKDVDFSDFAELANKWMQADSTLYCGGTDLTGDGLVDLNDLAAFVQNWLEGL